MTSRRTNPVDDGVSGSVVAGSLAVILAAIVGLSVVGGAAGVGTVTEQAGPERVGPHPGWGTESTSQQANDRFEPNDERDSATPISANTTIDDLQIVDGESDYFAVNLTAGEPVTVTTVFDDTVGDLDLSVTGPDDRELGTSISVSDNETVTFRPDRTGTYYVEVYGYAGASAPYSLDVAVGQGANSDNDRFEFNDDRETATHVQSGSLADLQIVDGESDYFAINLTAGESITATARFDDTEGDLDLQLLDPDGNSLDFSSSVSDDETVTGIARRNGTYYVEVYGFAGASAPYSLDISVSDTDTSSSQAGNTTDFEPNDEFETAATVTSGRYTGVAIDSPTDRDYYAVEVEAGESLTASIAFSDAEGDLDLTVSGPDRDRAEGSYSVTDDEQVELTRTVSGTYYIEVFGYSGATAPYTLGVSVDGEGPDVTDDTGDDSFDDDDPSEDPYDEDDPYSEDGLDLRSIEIGTTADGEIDEGDPESDVNRGHYEPVTFNGSAGELVTISMSSVEGDTYLLLRGPDGEVIERNDDGGDGLDSEMQGVQLPEDGEYTIVATSYSDFDTFEYTLSVTRGFGSGPQPTTMNLGAAAPAASPGDNITVAFELTNTADEAVPFIVETDLETRPAGWRITGHSADGATWRGSDAAFVFPSVQPNSSVEPSVTVELPANATTETFRAFGYAQRGQTSAPFTIEVDESN